MLALKIDNTLALRITLLRQAKLVEQAKLTGHQCRGLCPYQIMATIGCHGHGLEISSRVGL